MLPEDVEDRFSCDEAVAVDAVLILLYLDAREHYVRGKRMLCVRAPFSHPALDALEKNKIIVRYTQDAYAFTEDGEYLAEALMGAFRLSREALAEMLCSQVELEEPAFESGCRAFRFRIELDLDGRECWREVVVPAHWSFELFHELIQASFLWWDYHLYDFKLRSRGEDLTILDAERMSNDFDFGAPASRTEVDSIEVLLDEVFPRTRTATYSYDYGDGWEHKVKLVETIECFEGRMPVCTDGAGDAPPEDVGASWGFDHFLQVISDASDPDHDETVSWGKAQGFKPFSLEEVNRRIEAWVNDTLIDEWNEANGGE